MFRTLIYPLSGACDFAVELPHRLFCSRFVVCWRFGAVGFDKCPCCRLKHNKIASDIKLVFYSSAITMMYGPINIRQNALLDVSNPHIALSQSMFCGNYADSFRRVCKCSVNCVQYMCGIYTCLAVNALSAWKIHTSYLRTDSTFCRYTQVFL